MVAAPLCQSALLDLHDEGKSHLMRAGAVVSIPPCVDDFSPRYPLCLKFDPKNASVTAVWLSFERDGSCTTDETACDCITPLPFASRCEQ